VTLLHVHPGQWGDATGYYVWGAAPPVGGAYAPPWFYLYVYSGGAGDGHRATIQLYDHDADTLIIREPEAGGVAYSLLYDGMPIEAALDRLQDLCDSPLVRRAALSLSVSHF
jgi:hypothetical protein